MKKVFTILAAVLCLSFVAEKTYVFKFSEAQINYHWNNLNAVKALIDKSDLPHSQVVAVTKAIDSLQKDMQATLKIDSLKTK